MKISVPNCPKCGEPAEGTVDDIPGIALFGDIDKEGRTEWGGETRVCWDGQMSRTNDAGEVLVQCSDGHEWYTTIDYVEEQYVTEEAMPMKSVLDILESLQGVIYDEPREPAVRHRTVDVADVPGPGRDDHRGVGSMGKLMRYQPDDKYAFSHGDAIQHLFAQLHPDLDKEDLAYVEEVVMDMVKDEIQERAEPRKREYD